MLYRQDIKKLYSSVLFLFASLGTLFVYAYVFNGATFRLEDALVLIFAVTFFILWLLAYRWYYFETNDHELIRHLYGNIKTIPISEIVEVSYEDNPARPLANVIFNIPNGREYLQLTTGAWNPHTLLSLNRDIQQKNPNIVIRIDNRTKKRFEKEKDYHLQHPKNIFGWIVLGLRQLLAGGLVGLILVVLLKLPR